MKNCSFIPLNGSLSAPSFINGSKTESQGTVPQKKRIFRPNAVKLLSGGHVELEIDLRIIN